MRDIRYALRTLAKTPGFTLVALAALALGIGANTAIFSVVNALLLRPLPYPQADRLVEIHETAKGGTGIPVDYADYEDWKRQADAFSNLAISASFARTLTGFGPAEQVEVAFVSGNFFETLGVRPLAGRGFTASDDTRSSGLVALLTHSFWRSHFGGERGAVGRTLNLSGSLYTVAGVLPPWFHYHHDADVFVTISPARSAIGMDERGNHNNAWVIGRLRPDVTAGQADRQIKTITARIAAQYPNSSAGIGAQLVPLRQRLAGGARDRVLVLLGAVGLVLLIACVNVANLLLARGSARRKEMAIRAAVGASRGRIIRQLLTESVLLALSAGVLGTLLARASLSVLAVLLPGGFVAEDLRLDGAVLAFTVLVASLTGVLFGLAPALQASRASLVEAMKKGRRTSAGGVRSRLRAALVVAEVGMAMVLLVSAGLLMGSFWRLMQVNPGYRPENVITMRVGWPYTELPRISQMPAFYQRLTERVETLPGVTAAGGTWLLPLSGGAADAPLYRDDRPIPGPGQFPHALYHAATPGFFRAMGIPLLRGRIFSAADGKLPEVKTEAELDTAWRNTLRTAVISEAMARRFWPGEDPIGRRFRFGQPHMRGPLVEVVGVVGDVRHWGLDQPPEPEYYMSAFQEPRDLTLVIRSQGDSAALVSAVRNLVKQADANAPVSEIATLESIVARSVASRRTTVIMIGSFAALALLLAAIGIYGVISYSVTQRTHEIGIRMALGASRSDVLAGILKEASLLSAAGIVLGGAAALGATRLLAGMLFGVQPTDPATFLAVPAVLLAVALAASALPARRATRVDPIVALRYE